MTQAMQDTLTNLRMRLGAINVKAAPDAPLGAAGAVWPGSADEAAEAVRIIGAAGLRVWPAGAATYLGAVHPVPPDAILLFTTRLSRLVEYHPEDMVVTAEAGMTLDNLQALLRPRRQWVPLNPDDPEKATLGGIVATASSGSLRASYGPVKDYVLEIAGINAEGRIVRCGARVVKSVAGYDLPRLYTGSRGTLLIITQVTFRLRPVPETTVHLTLTADSWDAVYTRLDALAASPFPPAVLEIVREDLRDSARPTASIILQGPAETVDWQAAEVMQAVRGDGAILGKVNDTPRLPRTGDVELTLRTLPTETTAVARWLQEEGWRGAAAVYPAEGRIVSRFSAWPDSAGKVCELRAWLESRGGVLSIERMPRGWLGIVDPWGAPRPDAAMVKAIKREFDPNGVFPSFLPEMDA
jgi:glycolate oxidase FAD binding subunit